MNTNKTERKTLTDICILDGAVQLYGAIRNGWFCIYLRKIMKYTGVITGPGMSVVWFGLD